MKIRRYAFAWWWGMAVLLALPASAASWSTTCSNTLITAGFCPADSVGTPVVVIGWGLAPADAQRLATAICAAGNWQGAEDPDGLTCAQFADRELRRELQRRVKEYEVRARVEAEREAAEGEIEEPPADGKGIEQTAAIGGGAARSGGGPP